MAVSLSDAQSKVSDENSDQKRKLMDFTVSIDLEKVVVETDNDNSPDDEFGEHSSL